MNFKNNLSTENSSESIIKQDILLEKPWTIWLLMFLFWTLFSTVLTIQDYIIYYEYPDKFSKFTFYTLPLNSFTFFYAWFALTPLVFWFKNKFNFGRDENLPLNFIIHTFLALFTVAIYLFFTSFFMVFFVYQKSDFSVVIAGFRDRSYVVGHFQFLIYWAILGTGIAFDYYKKYREREMEASRLALRSSRLEAQLVKAQLDSLKMQLHPHFLFNTLHAISALMEDSPKRSKRMIARLGELLRSTLDIADQQTVTLEKEVALTKLYLEIEQERFKDFLEVKIDVPTQVLDCSVPSLILQPLIENAIKHGIKDEEKTAVIEIKVSKLNKRINIFVIDNGPGFSENQVPKLKSGIGLSNTKARLEQIYGKDHEFKTFNSEKGGAVVEISIPCQKLNEKK